MNVSDTTATYLNQEYESILILSSCKKNTKAFKPEEDGGEGKVKVKDADRKGIQKFFATLDESGDGKVDFKEIKEFPGRLDKALPEKLEVKTNQTDVYELYGMLSLSEDLPEYSELDESYTNEDHFPDALNETFGEIEVDYETVAAYIESFIAYNKYDSILGELFYKTRILNYDLHVPDVNVEAKIKHISDTGLVIISFSESLDLK